MLNYSKIHSSINYNRTPLVEVARAIDIPESTLRHRLKVEKLMPNDIEGIAEFFNRPIAHYFDKEEQEASFFADIPKEKLIKTKTTMMSSGDTQELEKMKLKLDFLQEQLGEKDKMIAALNREVGALQSKLENCDCGGQKAAG